MLTQSKRYKTTTVEPSKGRQLSGLFNIISSNLLLATEVLSSDFRIKAVGELEALSRKARILAKDLMSNPDWLNKQEQIEKISFLKHKLLALTISLTKELTKLDSPKSADKKTISALILVKRLLRDSQRGLVTIQD